LLGGAVASKRAQKRLFGPDPPLAKPCVSASSLRADPDCRALRLLLLTVFAFAGAKPRSRHARSFAPLGRKSPIRPTLRVRLIGPASVASRRVANGLGSRRRRRRHAGGPAISRTLWRAAFGEYLRRVSDAANIPLLCLPTEETEPDQKSWAHQACALIFGFHLTQWGGSWPRRG
jgi:hypothetical protein